MAVVNIREVYPGVSLGLWQLEETTEEMFDKYPHLLPYNILFQLVMDNVQQLFDLFHQEINQDNQDVIF